MIYLKLLLLCAQLTSEGFDNPVSSKMGQKCVMWKPLEQEVVEQPVTSQGLPVPGSDNLTVQGSEG